MVLSHSDATVINLAVCTVGFMKRYFYDSFTCYHIRKGVVGENIMKIISKLTA
jgi:hypothetical protein